VGLHSCHTLAVKPISMLCCPRTALGLQRHPKLSQEVSDCVAKHRHLVMKRSGRGPTCLSTTDTWPSETEATRELSTSLMPAGRQGAGGQAGQTGVSSTGSDVPMACQCLGRAAREGLLSSL
jgi:hypothetical protein